MFKPQLQCNPVALSPPNSQGDLDLHGDPDLTLKPEQGPRLLFFSGGTAINALAYDLKNYTHNAIHLVTPFDSGGSSAALRRAFDMPAVGDLRCRLLALADEQAPGYQELFQLFNTRLSVDESHEVLLAQLKSLARDGVSALQGLSRFTTHKNILHTAEQNNTKTLSQEFKTYISAQLHYFLDKIPPDFSLKGASIGNLIIAGAYLKQDRRLDLALMRLSQLMKVQGLVRPVVDCNLHLAATLSDGSKLVGQHLITGKEALPLSEAIDSLYLSENLDELDADESNTDSCLSDASRALIASADLICYPPGSFYSSLIANLLPLDVGDAIENNNCAKVFIPNLGIDPECVGLSLDQMLQRLIATLTTNKTRQDDLCGDPQQPANCSRLLNYILMDSQHGDYSSSFNKATVEALGIKIIDRHLVSEKSAPYYDPKLLSQALVHLSLKPAYSEI